VSRIAGGEEGENDIPGRQKNQENVDSTRVRDTVMPGVLEAFSGDRAAAHQPLARLVFLYRVTITEKRTTAAGSAFQKGVPIDQ